MKLLRFGKPGAEKPGLLDSQSKTGGAQKRKSLGIPMERSSNRWLSPSQEHRHRDSRRIPERIGCAAGVDAFRVEINQQTPQQLIKNIYLETLVNTIGSTNCRTYSTKRSQGQMQRTKIGSRTRHR